MQQEIKDLKHAKTAINIEIPESFKHESFGKTTERVKPANRTQGITTI
jgi:hypothetical protein